MRTDWQRAANRRNAQKSTGPKTAAGRARSRGNARIHGLTSPIEPSAVRAWYRVIVGDDQASPRPDPLNPVLRAAYRLAEAEARRARAVRVEEEHFAEMAEKSLKRGRRSPASRAAARDVEDPEELLALAAAIDDPMARRTAVELAKTLPKRRQAMRRQLSRIMTYRRHAEATRRKAFRAWLAAVQRQKS